MVDDVQNLGDIPDLSDVTDVQQGAFADGWYAARILEQRAFTDNNGNDRVFASTDEPSQKSGRNIRLQIEVKRKSDNRTLNTGYLINYRPEDLTQESVQAVLAQKDKLKEDSSQGWGEMFRPFMTLQRLGKLQKVAGVRQFQRNGNGGLDIHPLFNKTLYVRLGEDSRNAKFKEIKDIQVEAPKQVL